MPALRSSCDPQGLDKMDDIPDLIGCEGSVKFGIGVPSTPVMMVLNICVASCPSLTPPGVPAGSVIIATPRPAERLPASVAVDDIRDCDSAFTGYRDADRHPGTTVETVPDVDGVIP